MTSPQATDHLEVEWQYSVVDTDAAVLWLQSAAVPGYNVAPGTTKDLDDTYLFLGMGSKGFELFFAMGSFGVIQV